MKKLIHETTMLYKSVNLSLKVLILIGIFALIQTIATLFLSLDQTTPNDIALRSVMSNIFGFIFGSQLSENSNIKNRCIQTAVASFVAIICIITIVSSHWFSINQLGAASVEIRNLLFSAVGFLLSRAKSAV